ncbi:putative chemotaxis protein-glutamate methylesterase [Dyadobacter beijingensis]|uniref:protein-glutamate methylesterase n=1 Tax=Dyadobacter beijingensis TaxID=365489 RepID=A0ABQ2HXE9_9BACT|nr:chemotaxis protein CheB [Dyadobacter beijingensis]GGM92166.1 putative chemotaxis protein-glutamate methylesterase [Dyadobacter beijingensis]
MNKAGDNGPLSLVLVGGSSGSFVIFEEMIRLIRRPLSFALVFVLHRGKSSTAVLPELFKNKTNVVMSEPYHLDPIKVNSIYFAYPDYHLLIGPDARFYYDCSEKDFFSRPSIDATFMSAAVSGIPVKAAMLFSGSSADGAQGMKTLAEKGYPTYVQDPAEAESRRMPEEAIAAYEKHHVMADGNLFSIINDILQ